MTREFYFAHPRPACAEELNPTAGEVLFSNGAQIDAYEFDGSTSFRLSIDEWWFDAEAIDELISFLQAAKTQLKQ